MHVLHVLLMCKCCGIARYVHYIGLCITVLLKNLHIISFLMEYLTLLLTAQLQQNLSDVSEERSFNIKFIISFVVRIKISLCFLMLEVSLNTILAVYFTNKKLLLYNISIITKLK